MRFTKFRLQLWEIVLIAIVFLECNGSHQTRRIVFNDTSEIIHYNGAGRYDGEVIGYVKGKKSFIISFKNGLRHGFTRTYFEDGRLKNETPYLNNKKNGLEREYYDNGSLNYNTDWRDGTRVGSSEHYSESGFLMNYDAFDVQGPDTSRLDIVYYAEYDSIGRVLKQAGSVFGENIYSKHYKNQKVVILEDGQHYEDINDLYLTLATPPNFYADIDIIINKARLRRSHLTSHTLKVQGAFPGPGDYSITITGELKNSLRKAIRRDTTTLKIKIT